MSDLGTAFLFRPQRGSLAEAMSEVKEFSSLGELINFLNEELSHYGAQINLENLKVEEYGYDERIEWDTYIVYEEGYGVYGFINKKIEGREINAIHANEH